MIKIKKILVPLDFSDNSLRALTFAASIAKNNNASITLLNVIISTNTFYGHPDHAGSSAMILAENLKYLNEQRKQSKLRLNLIRDTNLLRNLNVNTKTVTDVSAYKQILTHSEKMKASLIVMGTRGTTSFGKTLMGTNTERVIRLTDIPVLTINKRSKITRFKKIVFASDFSRDAIRIYPFLNAIVKSFDSRVHLVRINTQDNFKATDRIYEDINRFKKRFSGKFTPTFRAANEIFEGITKYAKSIDADLIAIGVRRKKGLSRWLGTRIVESIIRNTEIPVLAIDIPR